MSAVLSPITTADPLATALEVYIEAKRCEDLAKKQRIEAEERILALSPAKEEGSQTIEVGGFKLTTTFAITYSCDDVQALISDARAANVPEQLVPVKTKVEFDGSWSSLPCALPAAEEHGRAMAQISSQSPPAFVGD